jgi:hypothetical protein
MFRIAASVIACLIVVLPGAPALASDDPPGVPVFHDREVKRDRADDVKADSSTPIDIRRVQYDHYKTGDNERFVVTVRFGSWVRKGSELSWGTSTGPGGYSLRFTSKVGGGFELERDNRTVRRPHVRRTVEGRTVTITIPWRKLGSPGKLVGLHFWAELYKPPTLGPGIDTAVKDRAVLN